MARRMHTRKTKPVEPNKTPTKTKKSIKTAVKGK